MRRIELRGLIGAMVLGMASTVAGCNAAADFCSRAVECEGGTAADREACERSFVEEEDRASLFGCSEAYAMHRQCIESMSRCMEGGIYAVPPGACDETGRAWIDCMMAP